jgi:hypothetical protein
LAELLASGRVFDFVLVVIALEMLGLLAYRAVRGRSLVAPEVFPNLIAAAGLLGAGRLVIAGVWWGYPCFLLSVALVAHLVALRWGARRAASCPQAQGLRRSAPSALSSPPVRT